MISKECGCRIRRRLVRAKDQTDYFDLIREEDYIEFCSLHAAAPIMLEALKALIGALGLRRPKSELVEDYGMLGLDAIQHSWDVIAAAQPKEDHI